jgi:hypothetical protein
MEQTSNGPPRLRAERAILHQAMPDKDAKFLNKPHARSELVFKIRGAIESEEAIVEEESNAEATDSHPG